MSDTTNQFPAITVNYSTTVPEKHPTMYAYALRAKVTKAENCTGHIFMFHRSKENNEGNSVDEFIHIASPLDIEEVPENAPDLANGMPYYRTDEVTLWFRNAEDLELAKKQIAEDVSTLVKTLVILQSHKMDKEEEVRYE